MVDIEKTYSIFMISVRNPLLMAYKYCYCRKISFGRVDKWFEDIHFKLCQRCDRTKLQSKRIYIGALNLMQLILSRQQYSFASDDSYTVRLSYQSRDYYDAIPHSVKEIYGKFGIDLKERFVPIQQCLGIDWSAYSNQIAREYGRYLILEPSGGYTFADWKAAKQELGCRLLHYALESF